MQLILIPEKRASILLKNRKKNVEKIENLLHAKIKATKTGEVEVSCTDAIEELITCDIIKAIGRGFSVEDSLKLLEDNSGFQVISITDFVNTKAAEIRLKGRIIGREGKIKSFLEKELDINMCIYGKTVSVIGNYNNIEVAKQIIELLLKGGSYASMRKIIQKNSENIR